MLRLNTKQLPKGSTLAPAINYVLKKGITLYTLDPSYEEASCDFNPEYDCYYDSFNIPINVRLDINNYQGETTLDLLVAHNNLCVNEDISFEKGKYDVRLTCDEMFDRCIKRLNTVSYRNSKNEITAILIYKLMNGVIQHFDSGYDREYSVGKYKIVIGEKPVLLKLPQEIIYDESAVNPQEGWIIYEWENADDLKLTRNNLDLGTAPGILYSLDDE